MPETLDNSEIARIAAHESWRHTPDTEARMAPARARIREMFVDAVDPNRELPPEIRAERAAELRTAYYRRLGKQGRASQLARAEQRRREVEAAGG